MQLTRFLFAFSSLAAIALAAPSSPQLPTQDAPWSVDTAKMEAAIKCPYQLTGAAGGIVLLVQGTALSAKDSWENGPYVDLLRKEEPGFDVCYVVLPNFALGDVQTNGEYVAWAILSLAKKSTTGKVSIVAHSQGAGCNVPFANIFWPSTRKVVHASVALAPDYHGTKPLGGLFVCAGQNFASSNKGCSPAFLQQADNSKYIQAQEKLLTKEIVPTTVFFTRTDQVVIPQYGPNPSAALPGSTQFPLQDICGPFAFADHLSTLAAPAGYALAVQAIKSKSGKADLSKFDKKQCFNFANSDLNVKDILPTISFINVGTYSLITSDGVYAMTEPPLRSYVCAAGAATGCAA